MESRRSSDAFAALVAAGLLLLAAWGNALALLLAAAAALVLGWVFFRWDGRRLVLAVLTGAVVAAVIVLLARQLH